MTQVRWGFLGAGWLASQATAAAVHEASGAHLRGVGARDRNRAAALGPDHAHDSYDAVIADPEVDAVYIALANDAHLPWILAAVEAGKHVLCEKPLVLTAQEAQRAFDAADAAGVLLVEAVWSRWHPRMQRVVELSTAGDLGEIRSFLGTFTFRGDLEGNYRLSPAQGGGALYDVGIYPLHALVACLPPDVEFSIVEVDRETGGLGVDLTTKVTLAWGGGQARAVGSFVMPDSQRLRISGARGELWIDDDQAFTSWCAPSELRLNGLVEQFAEVNAYRLMFEQVSARIRGEEAWVMPASDSVRVARLVDAIRAWRS